MEIGFAIGFGLLAIGEMVAIVFLARTGEVNARNEGIAITAMLAEGKAKTDAQSQMLAVEEQRDDAIGAAKKAAAERDEALERLAAVAKQRDEAQEAARANRTAVPSPTAVAALAGVNAELSALSDVPATGDGRASAPAGAGDGHTGQDAVRPAAATEAGGPGRRS